MAQIGDQLLGGRVIVVSVDPNGLITRVEIPLLGGPAGPFYIDFNPAQLPEDIEDLLSGLWF